MTIFCRLLRFCLEDSNTLISYQTLKDYHTQQNFISQLNKTTFKMLKKEEGEGMAMDIIPDCQFI